jgi:creatinine deaminase
MDPFLRAAIDEAKLGLAEGGLPIGSVLIRDGQIIARGHNRRVQRGDPMAHAEIDCLTNAGRQKTYRDTVTRPSCPVSSVRARWCSLASPR